MRTLNNKGVSLIELLAAVAIITISGTTLFYGFVAAARTSTKTSQRQMAQDGAQKLIEEFQNSSIFDLETNPAYASIYTKDWVLDSAGNPIINNVKDPSPYNVEEGRKFPNDPSKEVNDMYEYQFNNIAYTYQARAGQTGTNFVADITLTPLTTVDASDPTIKTELDTALSRDPSTNNHNTYSQRGTETNGFAMNTATKVSSNTMIIPEANNIYDGKSFVLSEEFNENDSSVVSNLYSAVYAALQEKNDAIRALSPTAPVISLDQFDSDFSTRYIPLTNMHGTSAKVQKKTEFLLKDSTSSGKVTYEYAIRLTYVFDFDFDLLLTNGTVTTTQSLSSTISTGTYLPTDVAGAASTYTVKKTGSKEYTVEYRMDIPGVTVDGADGATSGGVVKLEDETGAEVTEFNRLEEELPRIYLLYTPFDTVLGTSTTVDGVKKQFAEDEFEFKTTCSTPNAGEQIPRVFFVVQDQKHLIDTDRVVTLKSNNVKANQSTYGNQIQIFTNCLELIKTAAGSTFGPDNYLTNSYGQFIPNFYKMTVVVRDENGLEVARIETIKED